MCRGGMGTEKIGFETHGSGCFLALWMEFGCQKSGPCVEEGVGPSPLCVSGVSLCPQHPEGSRRDPPICVRSLPIVFDDFVDMEFGTGKLWAVLWGQEGTMRCT